MAMISQLWTEAVPGASDKYGPSTPTLYAVGTEATSGGPSAYTTVLTALIERPADFPGSGPLRVSLVPTWVPEGPNDFGLVFLLKAFHQGEEWLERTPSTMQRMPVWERFQP